MREARKAETRQIGKYLVKRDLRHEGPAAAYLAEQPGADREVTIKEVVVSRGVDGEAVTRFVHEAEVMARSSHPNVVQVYDLERVGETWYIVYEHTDGRSLRERLAAGPISLAQVFALMHGILSALDHGHRRNVLHRDLTPENVVVTEAGQVKVGGFGLARLIDDPRSSVSTNTGAVAGAPQYMSPEQVAGSKIDARSDIYSAGIILYELVCGAPPFAVADADRPFSVMAKHVQSAPPPPRSRRPGLDPELESLMLKALSKRPEDRFRSAEEFDRALSHVADRSAPGWAKSLEPGAGPETPAAPPDAASRRGRWRWPFRRR
jgi:serine/threonine-protein kinase